MALAVRPDRGHTEGWLWCFVFAAAVSWPTLAFAYPSAQDIPNHLARAFILLNADDPALSAHFEIRWHPVPNLAWDAFALTVGRVLPLGWTLKVFIVLGYALTMTGVFLLNRVAAGRWTWAPLAAAPFLFHAGTAKGFLNFTFAVGLTLVACAWWASNPQRSWGRRLGVACLLSLVLFYAHFAAWAIYGVFVLGSELARLPALYRDSGPRAFGRWLIRLARDGTQGVLPFVVMAIAIGVTGVEMRYESPTAGFESPRHRIYEALRIVDTGSLGPSILFLAVIAPFLLSLLACRVAVFSRRYATAIILLVALFFIVPDEIRGTAYIVWRIALGATLLAIASSIPVESITARTSRASLALILVVTLGLSGWQAVSAHHADIARRDYLDLVRDLPEGSSLLMAHSGITLSEIEYVDLGTYHISAYAVIERRILVHHLFAEFSPLVYRRPELNSTEVLLPWLEQSLRDQKLTLSEHFLPRFDWIVIHGPDPSLDRPLLPEVDYPFIREVGAFRLYCHADPVAGPGPGAAAAGTRSCRRPLT